MATSLLFLEVLLTHILAVTSLFTDTFRNPQNLMNARINTHLFSCLCLYSQRTSFVSYLFSCFKKNNIFIIHSEWGNKTLFFRWPAVNHENMLQKIKMNGWLVKSSRTAIVFVQITPQVSLSRASMCTWILVPGYVG